MRTLHGPFLPLLLSALGCVAAHAAGSEASPAAPGGIAFTDCRLDAPFAPGAVSARCGWLEIPEDDAAPAGRRLQLHVAVVPALSRRAAADPLFILAGGPGQAASAFYAAYGAAFNRPARTRDIVLVDQRGTGHSAPLDCAYPEDPAATGLDPARLRALTRACLETLGARTDPRQYTTSVAVRDLERVRIALGYDVINLYGISYGTRVAQHYVRRHPARVRSVVLDSAVPPEEILGPGTSANAQAALDRIFARCATDAACDARFPAIASDFAQLRARLAQPVRYTVPDPATGIPITLGFGVTELSGVARLLSYSDTTASLLPLLVHAAVHDENPAPLAAQSLLLSRAIDAQFAYGMHNAVVCSEDLGILDFPSLDRAAERAAYLGTAPLDGLAAICSVWPSGPVDADLHAPLTSDVPALVLSGEADPVTPPRYGERVAAQFADARHLVLNGHGHGQVTVPCVAGIIDEFLDEPRAPALDTGCVARQVPAPFLLDFTGAAP